MSRAKWAVVLAMVFLVVTAIGGAAWPQSAEGKSGEPSPSYTPERLVAEFGKAVVLIAAAKEGGHILSLGSGFLVTPDGQIVTNYHVIKGAYPALVKLTSGDVYDEISVIDYDTRRDIAVIKVKGFNLPAVKLGNSDDVKVGEHVAVIGNPQGLENSVSDGLLSGVRDSGRGYTMHQITAPISPGSSGSPVFNLRGEVIGIATSTIVEGQNLNFSVPMNYARGLIGGPVKCALKDMPSESEPTGGEAAQPSLPRERALQSLVDGVTQFWQACDCRIVGLPQSHTAGTRHSFWYSHGEKYVEAHVDQLLYNASELLSKACASFSDSARAGGDLGDLAESYLRCARKVSEEHNALLDLLVGPPQGNMQALFDRHNTAVNFAMTDAGANTKALLKVVDATSPALRGKLPPIVHHEPLRPGDGAIGVVLSNGVDSGWVLQVVPDSPADKAGIRAGDVILGVEGAPPFSSQDDCSRCICTHASQKLALRVRRGKDERVIQITPQPAKPK